MQIAEILDVLRKHRYPTERRLGILRPHKGPASFLVSRAEV